MSKSVPSQNEVSTILDGANFVVVQWGEQTSDPCHCAVTADAPPKGGYATGTDGRTYSGITRHEPFSAATHVGLIQMAANGVRRRMGAFKRKLVVALVADHDLTLPEAVAAVHSIPEALADLVLSGGPDCIASILEHDRPNGIRSLLADKAYQGYEFGQGVTVEDATGWDYTLPGDTWSRKVYCLDDDDQQTHAVNLTVRFAGFNVTEVYALDASGNYIGSPEQELPTAA